MIMQNFYSYWEYDDFTVDLWREALKDIPFDHADANLKRHVRTGKYPPTVAELAAGMVSHPEGRYIPNVAETRLLLAQMEADRQRSLADPARKARLTLVERSTHTTE